MKKTFLSFLFLFVSMFCAVSGHAQNAAASETLQPSSAAQPPAAAPYAARPNAINITAQSIPRQASFAEPFDVRFELAHEPGYIVELDKETLPQGFELTAQHEQTLSPGTMQYQMTFMPFTLGISTFTAVTFELKEQAGGKPRGQAHSEPQTIDVKPVSYFKESSLRDIRPPYIPSSWIIWLLCLIVFGLIGFFAWRFYKEVRNRSRALQQTRDDRPADVIALSKIDALLQSGLWEKAQYKIFYIELGDILREYFWRRFQQDVSSDTSVELLRRARKIPQLASLLSPLRMYLNSSDLVKFAKVTPTQDTMQQDVDTVREIVRETSPRPVKEER